VADGRPGRDAHDDGRGQAPRQESYCYEPRGRMAPFPRQSGVPARDGARNASRSVVVGRRVKRWVRGRRGRRVESGVVPHPERLRDSYHLPAFTCNARYLWIVARAIGGGARGAEPSSLQRSLHAVVDASGSSSETPVHRTGPASRGAFGAIRTRPSGTGRFLQTPRPNALPLVTLSRSARWRAFGDHVTTVETHLGQGRGRASVAPSTIEPVLD